MYGGFLVFGLFYFRFVSENPLKKSCEKIRILRTNLENASLKQKITEQEGTLLSFKYLFNRKTCAIFI